MDDIKGLFTQTGFVTIMLSVVCLLFAKLLVMCVVVPGFNPVFCYLVVDICFTLLFVDCLTHYLFNDQILPVVLNLFSERFSASVPP